MIKYVLSITIVLSIAVFISCGSGSKISFEQGDDQIDILVQGKPFTSWVYRASLVKPILYPVHSPSGHVVMRAYPFQEIEGESRDHPHHTGIFFTTQGVNGMDRDNFWGARTPPPQIKQISIQEMGGGNEKGLLADLHWIGEDGRVLLEENRTMIFYAEKESYAIDFEIRLTARDTTVVFADTKEGMFAIRVADWLREKNGTGRYLNAHGKETEANVWGRRSEWLRLEGEKEGKRIGIAIFNHPSSVNFPTYWHARAYGLFSANPLGQFDFQKQTGVENPEPFDLTLEPGESALFRFRMHIYEGPKNKGDLDLIYDKYSRLP